MTKQKSEQRFTIDEGNFGMLLSVDVPTIVVGQVDVVSNGGRGTITIVVFNPDGTKVRELRASVHYYTGSDCQVPSNCISMPVRKGQSYIVGVEQTCPDIRAWFQEVPMPAS